MSDEIEISEIGMAADGKDLFGKEIRAAEESDTDCEEGRQRVATFKSFRRRNVNGSCPSPS